MYSATTFLTLAAAAAPALAGVFTTSPVEGTTWTAGSQVTVSWMEGNTTPSLADFGSASIGIYTGNAIQQTLLQTIATGVNVATTASVVFTPDASIGPNGDLYFLRFTSDNLKDANNSAFPAEAFSAKFTMAGMSGTFNQTVQAQVDGTSTAPIGGSTAAAATGSGSNTAASAHPTGSSGLTSAHPSASASAGSASHSGAAASASHSAAASGASRNVMGLGVAAVAGLLFATMSSAL